ncbi:phage integrase family protein [Paraburkholderia sp. MPAMCS5]|uniref:phage integrase family protein n=1 Tax=Paraburkholderia sp. MPAMCS5 TaxID=3112563 RepID=UPI002E183A08|nr:phage integrase family protein [Paraburkholderia sp. MPAMCS5]
MKPAARRLTRQHFALYRGWLEGAAIGGLHSAYGDAGTDVRVTRRLIATMRDALSVAARRARDTEAAHLLRLKPGSIPLAELHGRDDVPTLEDYRAQVDPDGVYGEAELIELYRGDFPPPPSPALDRKIARNARLRARQAAALGRMERALVQDPAPGHPLDGWFEPAVAARLAAAGLTTLADLLALIQRRRQRWYTAVPRLGPKGAQRITDWLDLHARSLHCILSPLATTPRRQLAVGHPVLTRPAVSADVAPLESLRVPPELDGSQGLNRAPVPAHQAELATDLDAVNAWIAIRGERSAHTARAYRREAERLLLWAIIVRRKPLSSLNTPDCREYINGFLADPRPAERWIGNGKAERFDLAWRPFAKKLPPASRETARKILSAMCSWLVEEHYLRVNPFHGLQKVDSAKPLVDVTGRTLTHAQWRFVLQTVSRPLNLPGGSPADQRDCFALLLAYATGLRRTELATATTGALSRKALDAALEDAWTLRVMGKGRRERQVPMPHRLMEALAASLQLRPTPCTLETAPGDTPLIAHLKTGRALSPDALARLYKAIFRRAADALAPTYPGAAADLKRASTHWLRHTHANHALDAGGDLRDVQTGLGHASLGTTTLYTKGDATRQYRAVERFFEAALDDAAAASPV